MMAFLKRSPYEGLNEGTTTHNSVFAIRVPPTDDLAVVLKKIDYIYVYIHRQYIYIYSITYIRYRYRYIWVLSAERVKMFHQRPGLRLDDRPKYMCSDDPAFATLKGCYELIQMITTRRYKAIAVYGFRFNRYHSLNESRLEMKI